MKTKKGSLLNSSVIHIALIGIIFVLFFAAISGSVNGRGVKQQVLEKQTALLINAAEPGMTYEIQKRNLHGTITAIELIEGHVRIAIDGLPSIQGQPYTTKYSPTIQETENSYLILIR